MRGTVARRIRRQIYGDHSPRARSYFFIRRNSSQIVADGRRDAYQKAKRSYKEGE